MLTPEEEASRVAFRELPANAFPFTVEFFKVSDGDVIHTIVVNGPGMMQIPAIAKEIGEPVGTRTIFPDGQVQETIP